MKIIIPKILTTTFLLLIIFQTGFFIYLNLFHEPVFATNSTPYMQVTIPNVSFLPATNCSDNSSELCINWIALYIKGIYKYAVGIVGIVAAVTLMFGGILYITAGGSAEKITNARSWIGSSLTGLVLVLSSYMLLSIVSTNLVNFDSIKLGVVSSGESESGTESEDDESEEETFCSDATNDGLVCEDGRVCENGECTGYCSNINEYCSSEGRNCCPGLGLTCYDSYCETEEVGEICCAMLDTTTGYYNSCVMVESETDCSTAITGQTAISSADAQCNYIYSTTNPCETITASEGGIEELATRLIDNPDVSFSTIADCGGNMHAQNSIEEIASTGNATACSSGCTNESDCNTTVTVEEDLLDAIDQLSEYYIITVTSITTGNHTEGSFHYTGKAMDITTANDEDIDDIVSRLENMGFYVLNEGDHIHFNIQ